MNLKYLLLVSTLFLTYPAFAENSKPKEKELPTTCEGAIKDIFDSLDTESIETLKQTEKKDLIMFHFSWGMGIRNHFDAWSDGSPIRTSCAKMVGEKDIHPDGVSGIIMDGVWELVHE